MGIIEKLNRDLAEREAVLLLQNPNLPLSLSIIPLLFPVAPPHLDRSVTVWCVAFTFSSRFGKERSKASTNTRNES